MALPNNYKTISMTSPAMASNRELIRKENFLLKITLWFSSCFFYRIFRLLGSALALRNESCMKLYMLPHSVYWN